MKKMVNSTHVEGYIYEHKLEKKISGEKAKNPGVEFINGTLSIATDDAMLNVVSVHFTYVTEVTAKGKPNASYGVLSNIIEGKMGSVMEHGKENAGKVRIDSAVDLNEWYDSRSQGEPLVSTKRNEGGFVHVTQELCDEKARATFNTDMLITSVIRMEADEERGLPERGIVKGCVFDFRGALKPIDYVVYAPKAIDYFENLGASQKSPVFTRVQGIQRSQTIVKETVEESAFGEPIVKTQKSTQREFVINWAQPEPYEWDSEETILASELAEAISNRELYLADMKKRNDEYQATKGNALGTTDVAPAAGEYKF